MRRPQEAEPLLRDALELFTAVNGAEHPNTLACMNNLANTLRSLGRHEEAETLLRRVLTVRRRTLGTHPSVYSTISNLARVLQAAGRLDEAEALDAEALDGFRRVVGPEHRSTLTALNNLATVRVARGRPADAEPLYVQLIEIAHRTQPPRHWITLLFERNHGRCLTALQRYEEAEALLRPAAEGLEASFGRDHQHVHSARQYMVELYDAWGKPEEAARWRDADPAPAAP
jgi:tetratricopeptide (TPR) repeat protein